ncbi:hypothetical protein P3L10_026503 [Capsicum annuum]|uniref:uncharacterized protein LOC124887079 n=1 Tax=Capsicum annuum TaxID=4072 RepID=UPI001FB0CC0B|nr:uncharacterized protein LOC124887079 [Capsicum annuum]
MTRGGYRADKSSGISKTVNHAKIPCILLLVVEQDNTSSIPSSMPTNQILLPNHTPLAQTLGERSALVILEISLILPNQSNPTGQNMNAQSNTAVEGTTSQRNVSGSGNDVINVFTVIIGVGFDVPKVGTFFKMLQFHDISFKSGVDPNGINWKGVSKDVKDGYFGEFKKNFYWYASVSEAVVKQQWSKKAWMKLWESDRCIKNSKINSKNHCGSREVAARTHTGGSITAGEHQKKLQAAGLATILFDLLRCPFSCCYLGDTAGFLAGTLCEFLPLWAALLVGAIQNFIGYDVSKLLFFMMELLIAAANRASTAARVAAIIKKYEEIVRNKLQCESEIDQLESYYEATGGAKKKKLFGLGSEAESYYGKKSCACNASTLSVPRSVSLSTTNLEEFVKQLIPALTTHFLSIVIERIGGIMVQEGAVLDPPPTIDDDDDVDS